VLAPIIEVRNISRAFLTGHSYSLDRRRVVAVDDVSFSVAPGTTFGIVGESGSGKSTTARMICGLERTDAGNIVVDGRDVTTVRSRAEILQFRRVMQMVFQDPYAALNPNWTIGDLVGEGLRVHGLHPHARPERIAELLGQCGLGTDAVGRYPHEFSGGQRQRICIARALAVDPKILVLDEPVSALDVSIQAQILILLQDLQKRLGMTYVMISHNLAIVEHMCDSIAVMRGGKIVESGQTSAVISNPQHEYTAELLRSTPVVSF